MELKILIRTPKGLASVKGLKLKIIKKILFRKANIKKEYVNKQKNKIVWVVECTYRNYPSIIKSLTMYTVLLKQVSSNKLIRRALKRMADTPQDYKDVMDLLKSNTEIQLIKKSDKDIYMEEDKGFFKRFFKA